MLVKPNYENGSIVNLMASIGESLGVSSPYSPLDRNLLPELDMADNILLILFDGVGYNYLNQNRAKTLLGKHLKGKMTSVFPPSTGSAVSSFMTGLAPQQHAVTGWFVYLKEYGMMSRILPFTSTVDWNQIDSSIRDVIDTKSIFTNTNRDHFVVAGRQIIGSKFTAHMAGKARRLGYTDMESFFEINKKAVMSSPNGSYTYSYWPAYDEVSHMLGSRSKEAKDQLLEFDSALQKFIEEIQGTNTTIIVTSDHGFNDVKPENMVHMADHPDLMDCLILPLGGDSRSAYCYVRPSKVNAFEKYVGKHLDYACGTRSSKAMIEEEWFGKFEPNPKLSSRVGDYILLAQDGHCFLNSFPGQEPLSFPGHHGGTSEDEMIVPFVRIDC
ncbi:MAG: alkaline phosphatase family protein [Promethearchaeota archaeon]